MKLKFHTYFEKVFCVFSAPDLHSLLGERQTYWEKYAILKAFRRR